MREIKFRAWNTWKKEMIKVNQWSFDGGMEDFILMQYTGLKDKNGKEIYEGDVVTDKYGCKYKVGFFTDLNWDDGGSIHSGFYVSNGGLDYNVGFDKLTVIGNIYSNPDLIKN